jgi:hypothetical protein
MMNKFTVNLRSPMLGALVDCMKTLQTIQEKLGPKGLWVNIYGHGFTFLQVLPLWKPDSWSVDDLVNDDLLSHWESASLSSSLIPENCPDC